MFKDNFDGKDDTTTGLSVADSIFGLVNGLGGSYGSLAPDPFEKGIAVVVVAATNAFGSLLKTSKSARTLQLDNYNYITEGV